MEWFFIAVSVGYFLVWVWALFMADSLARQKAWREVTKQRNEYERTKQMMAPFVEASAKAHSAFAAEIAKPKI